LELTLSRALVQQATNTDSSLSNFVAIIKLGAAPYTTSDNSMARPTPRIDLLKRIGKPIAFSDEDRAAIEAKYGHKLTSEQWEQITGVTSIIVTLIPGIKGATRLRVVLSKFLKLEAAAKSLRSEFNEIPDRGNFTPQEIYWAFLLVGGIAHDRVRSFYFSKRYSGL
jgi:hypothetical protein